MNILDMIKEQLSFPIKSTVTIGDVTIVLIDDDKIHEQHDTSLNRNVYAFDADGNLMWQIQELPIKNKRVAPYATISVKDGKLYTYNWIGMDYLVDLKDGSIHFFGPPRRPW